MCECSWTPNFCGVSKTLFISAYSRWACCTWAATDSNSWIPRVHPLAGFTVIQHDGVPVSNCGTNCLSCSINVEHFSKTALPPLSILKAILHRGCPRTGSFITVVCCWTAQPLWLSRVIESNFISHSHWPWSTATIDLEHFSKTGLQSLSVIIIPGQADRLHVLR